MSDHAEHARAAEKKKKSSLARLRPAFKLSSIVEVIGGLHEQSVEKTMASKSKRVNSKSSSPDLELGPVFSFEFSIWNWTKMVHVKSSVMIGHFSKEPLYPQFQFQIQ